jgi:thioredoxin 1
MFGPVFEKASEEHPDAVFGKVDTEAQPEVAAAFNISSIPTLMIVRDGIVLYAQPGALPEAALEQLITKASELDMDEVRASLEAEAQPAEA